MSAPLKILLRLKCLRETNFTPLGLVVEDAISGLKSGRAAGSLTLAVCTSTERDVIARSDAQPDFIVTDLTKCVCTLF